MVDLNKFVPDLGSKATTSHEEIINWVEKNKGKPEIFDDIQAGADKIGIRIDFEGKEDDRYMNESVEQRAVSWKKFFDIFDKQELAFIYVVEPKMRDKSMAYKFIKKENVDWESII